MFYIRGHRSDYDRWAQLGCKGWDYDSVLPHFKSIESVAGEADEYRGKTGPQSVALARHHMPLVDQAIAAALACGHRPNPDYNGVRQSGVGVAQNSQKYGRRHSSASAFLTPIRRRKNLTVKLGAQVLRVLFDGKRASGVAYQQDRKEHIATCTGEVSLCAGSMGSPKILMHSGIGPVSYTHLTLPTILLV